MSQDFVVWQNTHKNKRAISSFIQNKINELETNLNTSYDYRMVDGVDNADRWLWDINGWSRSTAAAVDQLDQPGPPDRQLHWPNSPGGHLDHWTDKTFSPDTGPVGPIQRGHDLPPCHQYCHLLLREKVILVLKDNYCEKCQKWFITVQMIII